MLIDSHLHLVNEDYDIDKEEKVIDLKNSNIFKNPIMIYQTKEMTFDNLLEKLKLNLINLTNIKELPNTQLGASVDDAIFNCEGGKYAYYAVPASLKNKVVFYVDDTNPDATVTSYSTYNTTIVNDNGNSIEYTIFKLDNLHNTQFELDIKVD